MSLGPSNDDSPAVAIEIRAAELHLSWTPDTTTITDEEYTGWLARHDDGIPLDSPGRLAGWLSREIRYAGTERDIGTWAWDISRPLAEQCPGALGNAASEGTACVCGHAVEEHGNDPEYPGSSACGECDCIAYESDGAQ